MIQQANNDKFWFENGLIVLDDGCWLGLGNYADGDGRPSSQATLSGCFFCTTQALLVIMSNNLSLNIICQYLYMLIKS